MTTNNLNNECPVDFTVTNGKSGSLRKVRIQNDNNTASSASLMEHYIAGTTADDPYCSCIIGNTSSYALGVDVTDSQEFKLGYAASASATPSSTEFLNIDTDCHNHYPLQPCFRAYVNTTVSNVTGDNTEYTVLYDAEEYDIGSNYNTATGAFVAPIAGRYLFIISPYLTGITSSHTGIHQYVRINGSQYVKQVSRFYNLAYGGTNWIYNYFCIANLAASDSVKTSVQVSGGTKVINVQADTSPIQRPIFAGYLLG